MANTAKRKPGRPAKTTTAKTTKVTAKKAPMKKTVSTGKASPAKKTAVKKTTPAKKTVAAKKTAPAKKTTSANTAKSAAKTTARKSTVKAANPKTSSKKIDSKKSGLGSSAKKLTLSSVTKPLAKKAQTTSVKKVEAKSVPAKKSIIETSSISSSAPIRKAAVKTVSENKAMGRGLAALLSSEDIVQTKRESVVELKINDISPNNGQPRKVFNDESLNELAASIEEIGVIQPIIVQRKGDGYSIVAGERRWRAARIAGLSTIPAIVREDLSDTETMEQALIENILREDLNPIEEASAMQDLLVTHKLTQEKLSKLLGKPRATIANTIRILNLDESLQEFVSRGDLSEGHAKVILSLKEKEDQRKVADVIMAREMNVRQAEVFVKKYIEAQNNPVAKKQLETPDIRFTLSATEVETKLKKQLGAKVKLKVLDSNTGRGRIVIDYKDNTDLDRLLEILCNE